MGHPLLLGFLLQQHFSLYSVLVLNGWAVVICRLQRSMRAHTPLPHKTTGKLGQLLLKRNAMVRQWISWLKTGKSIKSLHFSQAPFLIDNLATGKHTHTHTHTYTLTPALGNPRHSIARSVIPPCMKRKGSHKNPAHAHCALSFQCYFGGSGDWFLSNPRCRESS